MHVDRVVEAARQAASPYTKPLMDDIVFHYTCALPKIISSNALFLTRYDQLNDKREYLHGIRLIEAELRAYYRRQPIDIVQRMIGVFECISSPPRTPFIFSTCLSEFNCHLWSEYANCPQGTAMLIRPKALIKAMGANIDFGQVVYDDFTKRKMVVDVLDAMIPVWRSAGTKRSGVAELMHIQLFLLSTLMKQSKWAREEEIRFIKWMEPTNRTISWRYSGRPSVTGTTIAYVRVDLGRDCLRSPYGVNS
jgi:hypothetical protein